MRNGKIAKLPFLVRKELNERMEKEEAGPTLLAWLNGEPKVKEVLVEKFDGKEISKQNLSDWRRGGFREWQIQREFTEAETGMDPIRWDVDLPALAENFLARMMGYYAVLMTGWDGRPDPEREARARVLRGLLRDGSLMQKWVSQMDKLKDELRERRRQRESIWDGGGGSLKEILAMAAALRAQKNGESKAEEEQAEAAPEAEQGAEPVQAEAVEEAEAGKCPGGTRLREDAMARQAPSQATGTLTLPGIEGGESRLVAVGQGESLLREAATEGGHTLAAGLDGGEELPQKNVANMKE